MKEHLLFQGKTKNELLELLLIYQRALGYNLIASITDLKGTILYANKLFCDISKYTEQELLGQNHRIVNSRYHSRVFFENMWGALGKGELWHGEIKNADKQGISYWVDTMIVPLKDPRGIVFQYLSLQMVITEKKRFDQEKINMLLETEELLNMVSHKVRGPAATCMGLIQLFEIGSKNPTASDETLKYLQEIKKSIHELDLFTKEFTNHLMKIRERKQYLINNCNK
jgi:PAS domain S-box-containing protein